MRLFVRNLKVGVEREFFDAVHEVVVSLPVANIEHKMECDMMSSKYDESAIVDDKCEILKGTEEKRKSNCMRSVIGSDRADIAIRKGMLKVKRNSCGGLDM